MIAVLKDDTELSKQFSGNAGFRRELSDAIFQAAYGGVGMRGHR